ncbi:testis-specific protein TEX28 [Phascolarctos cinereus]|uniref:Testis-specific protein TEX28 n=1 Tax=Phascolarctos cinereus TaxID=38626 RepID=A0A6P5JHU3_PHACI|nr:testis-specific protein TEX28 [Phascolarctos cinereus]
MQAKHMKSQSSPHPLSCPIDQDRSPSTNDEGYRGNPRQSVSKISRSLQNSIKYRILYLSEQLEVEKARRDENTVGYLKLVSKAHRHQAIRIRQAFEKVNQRSSATIAHIEHKLQQYHQQLQEMEEGRRPKRSSLKEEKAKKSQESADKARLVENPKTRAEESQSTNALDILEKDVLAAASPQEKSSKKDSLGRQQSPLFLNVKEELEDIKKSHSRLELFYQALKEKYLTDLQLIIESLHEDKYRQKVIEEQVNDHMQGHLSEISHIKKNLACTEEKMTYLSYDRAKEIWEVIRTFQNQISKLETQQQVAQLEITEKPRSHSQVFLAKFMSLILTLTTILLICVSTICTSPFPFIRCRLCFCTIFLLIGLGMVTWQKYSILYTYWHEQILSRLKLYYTDSRPLMS